MTQEDKELLFKDLSARLPYGVIVAYKSRESVGYVELSYGNIGHFSELGRGWWLYCKPYLRSMSSMTKEEKKELERLIDEKLNRNTSQEDDEWTPWILHDTTGIRNSVGGERFYFDEMSFIYDWLNAHHFDYRGLIPMGLALEAPEGMYN